MEEVILQQIESLEMVLNSQQRRIDLYSTYLRELASIEENFIIFGKLSKEEKKRKQLILEQWK
jgi:hypothetical protein